MFPPPKIQDGLLAAGGRVMNLSGYFDLFVYMCSYFDNRKSLLLSTLECWFGCEVNIMVEAPSHNHIVS